MSVPGKIGRPTKFTPETIDKIVEAIELGATYELACNYAGVSYRHFRTWIVAGETGKNIRFNQFYHTIKKAEGNAAKRWLAIIDKAASKGEWQAAAWKLERRYWKSYSRNAEVLGLIQEIEEFKASLKHGGLKYDKANGSEQEEDGNK